LRYRTKKALGVLFDHIRKVYWKSRLTTLRSSITSTRRKHTRTCCDGKIGLEVTIEEVSLIYQAVITSLVGY
jgi:hypothetical protein